MKCAHKVDLINNKLYRKMLRTVLFSSIYLQSRKFALKTSIKKLPSKQCPIVTCKIKKYDLYQGAPIPASSKFGTIPLASSGWYHNKAKQDYFTIHPIAALNNHVRDDTKIFDKLGLDQPILDNIKNNLNILQSSYIQYAAIPQILAGDHTHIAAETGCGKTLAYLIPIIQQILCIKQREQHRNFNTPLGLVITPGRELATQIGEVAEKLCENLNIKVKVLLGGRTKQQMLNPNFEDIDLLIGSMGAVSKLVTTSVYRMQKVRHVVLDEADTLLDDSFNEKLFYFLKRFPFYRNHLEDISQDIIGTQLIMAAATMPTNSEELLRSIIDPNTMHEVISPSLHKILPHIPQTFLRMSKSNRPMELLTIVKTTIEKKRPIIIFSNKSTTSDYISLFLNDHGVECINLNGDMLHQIRLGRFHKFQSGEVDILSTTDIASRGLDTTRARHVLNFDFPLHVADYIHRIGRTGRLGSHENCAVTNFVSSLREIPLVQKIEHTARTSGVLPNVNANIKSIIKNNILKQFDLETKELIKQQ